MRIDREDAVRLRKLGKSYTEIRDQLGISKSTLSYWLRDVMLSNKAKIRLKKLSREKSIAALMKRNKNQTVFAKKRAHDARSQASTEVDELTKNNLFLVGIALYWGEGYKKGAEGSKWKCVDFTNSDPEMIKMIMRFFREICDVAEDKFAVQLMLHKNLSDIEALEFWSRTTGIDRKQFMKPSRVVSSASSNKVKSILKYGTVHIRVHDVNLFHRIIGWIDGLKKQTECSSVG